MSINPDVESEVLYHQGGRSDGCFGRVPVGEKMVAYFIPWSRSKPAYSEVYERCGEALVFIGTSSWPPDFENISPPDLAA